MQNFKDFTPGRLNQKIAPTQDGLILDFFKAFDTAYLISISSINYTTEETAQVDHSIVKKQCNK